MAITIRNASIQDMPWILGELKKFSQFFDSKLPLFADLNHAQNFIQNLIENHVFLLAEGQEGYVGFIVGTLGTHPFNPGIILLGELFFWVSEEHRNTRATSLLLNAFLAHGKEHADWVTISLEAKSALSEKHLIKRGFKLQERSYLLEVE